MITGTVTGAEAVITRFRTLPPKLHQQLVIAVTRLTLKLQRNVKAGKLSGQVLKVRTGTLRRSIDQNVTVGSDSIVGRVSTNVRYGRTHEYGFTGPVTVRSHLRTIKQAFGRPIASKAVTIGSHTRNVDLPARSFLRSALKDLEQSGVIDAEMKAAVRRATT